MKIEKYSIGLGDRFAHEAGPQLQALKMASDIGIHLTPVWNKSNREHDIIKSSPQDTRIAVEKGIAEKKFLAPYFIDADHINLSNVDRFISSSDFFTIDVADFIGKKTDYDTKKFIEQNKKLIGKISLPGIKASITLTHENLGVAVDKYIPAITEAGNIYRYVENKKGRNNFITEVSMDEVSSPQTPEEFLVILYLLAKEEIPLQTIAPRFIGEFHKGVDYIGNITQFANDFEQFLLLIDYAISAFGLPANLKLSLHSGSDKFSIYPKIKNLLAKYNKGLHLKTAGTTWLEEVTGLALAGPDSLRMVQNIYKEAYVRIDELCAPYKTVINIEKNKLPSVAEVSSWSSDKFANSLRHVQDQPDYNPHFRQLLHVGYKIAAEYGSEFISALEQNGKIIGQQVTENIFNRHIKRIFVAEK